MGYAIVKYQLCGPTHYNVLNPVFGIVLANMSYILWLVANKMYIYIMIEKEFGFSIHKRSYTCQLRDQYNSCHPLSIIKVRAGNECKEIFSNQILFNSPVLWRTSHLV